MKNDPTTAASIDELHRELETLAKKSEWSELVDLMKRRDDLLLSVEPENQAEVFRAAVQNNDHVTKMVRAGRREVSEHLVALRRGQGAVDYYASNSDAIKHG